MPASSPSVHRFEAHPAIRWLAWWSCAYLALAIAATWPVARVLTTHLPHDLGDPLLSLTLLQWHATTALFTSHWWNGVGFYPLAETLTLSDPRLGASLVSTPIIWTTGSAIAGYNIVFVLSYACSALAAHALVRRLTGSDAAGLIAGCAFGFAPFRTAHLPHLELLLAWWMPLALLAAHGWLETRRRRWLALLAFAIAAQGLFAAYYLPMLGVLLALWALWFAAGRVPARQCAELGVAGLLGVAVLAPIFLHYSRVHDALGVYRDVGQIRQFSADVSSLWSAAPDVRSWPSFGQDNGERYLFPGLAIVLLTLWHAYTRRAAGAPARVRLTRLFLGAIALAALGAALVSIVDGPWRVDLGPVRLLVSSYRKPLSVALVALICVGLLSASVRAAARTRSIFAFYVLAAGVMFLLALGPDPTLLGIPVVYKAPYTWLMRAPIFEHSLRAPARFGMVVALALAVAAGLSWHQVGRRLPARRARWLTAMVSAAIMAEGWAAPLVVIPPPERFSWPTRCAGLPRLELPLGEPYADAAAQYRAVLDRTRSVNGLSGYMPPHTLALIFAIRVRDADAIVALAEHGPFCVSTDAAWDAGAFTRRWLSAHPLSEPLGSAPGHVFHLIRRATPIAAEPPTAADIPLTAASSREGPVALGLLTDGNHTTMWATPERQHRDQVLSLTLSCPAAVQSVALLQDGGRFARRLAIEVSGDAEHWQPVWKGTTGGLVVRSALRDPRRPWIDIRLGVPGVRQIRLRILRGSAADWAVSEVRVRGACAG